MRYIHIDRNELRGAIFGPLRLPPAEILSNLFPHKQIEGRFPLLRKAHHFPITAAIYEAVARSSTYRLVGGHPENEDSFRSATFDKQRIWKFREKAAHSTSACVVARASDGYRTGIVKIKRNPHISGEIIFKGEQKIKVRIPVDLDQRSALKLVRQTVGPQNLGELEFVESVVRVKYSLLVESKQSGALFLVKVVRLQHHHARDNEVEIEYKGHLHPLPDGVALPDKKSAIRNEIIALKQFIYAELARRRYTVKE